MRRKNRQLKLILDIPEEFETEEDFMRSLMQRMDSTDWQMDLPLHPDEEEDEDAEIVYPPIHRITLGEIEIEREEEEEE